MPMAASLDVKALWDISYGLFIVTSASEGRLNGQIANTVFQVSATPPRVAASINKLNLTHEYIRKSGVVAISTLKEQASMALVGLFGFRSGRDVEKLAQTTYALGANGCPIVTESALSAMEGRVVGSVDGGTHTVFIIELTRAEVLAQGTPLTYATYQNVKKGHSPRNAPTYRGDPAPADKAVKRLLECPVCGYLYDPEVGDPDSHVPPGTAFEDLPSDWVCPVCGAPKKDFVTTAGR
jgi:flavin reductase (DIM6/NTAB) family NADH-FMN oxidoreductase RutF/rubredoxin